MSQVCGGGAFYEAKLSSTYPYNVLVSENVSYDSSARLKDYP